MYLELQQLSVQYPGRPRPAVDQVSFGLKAGQIGVLIGPSGCGKTTLLRAVAGLEAISAGRIALAGETVSAPGQSLAPENRRIGMVFQDYALFPHLDVGQNVGFGIYDWPKAERQARVGEVLDLVGLGDVRRRYPHELSGGQQQRVALARALAPKPQLLLLDEPFSNLDVDLRERLAHEVRGILKAAGATALFVTHDQLEAFAIGDVIGVMHEGSLHQWADAYTLYHRPATRFVADFIGHGVFSQATVELCISMWSRPWASCTTSAWPSWPSCPWASATCYCGRTTSSTTMPRRCRRRLCARRFAATSFCTRSSLKPARP
jgi:iron(III) transport system ATP-binding protein